MQVVICIYFSTKGDLTSKSFSLGLKSPKMGVKSHPIVKMLMVVI